MVSIYMYIVAESLGMDKGNNKEWHNHWLPKACLSMQYIANVNGAPQWPPNSPNWKKLYDTYVHRNNNRIPSHATYMYMCMCTYGGLHCRLLVKTVSIDGYWNHGVYIHKYACCKMISMSTLCHNQASTQVHGALFTEKAHGEDCSIVLLPPHPLLR